MCVGIPMTVVALDGLRARGRDEATGEHCEIDLALIGPVALGAEVLVHVGVGVRTLDPDEARDIRNALQALACAGRGEPFEHLFSDLIAREPQLPAHLIVAHANED